MSKIKEYMAEGDYTFEPQCEKCVRPMSKEVVHEIKNEVTGDIEQKEEFVCEECNKDEVEGGDFSGAGDEDNGEIPTNNR